MMPWIMAAVTRAFGLTLFWGSLGGWAPQYAIYGAVAIVAATVTSLVLLPPRREVRIRGWPKRMWFTLVLAAWFLGQSARGGVDVALRALSRPVDIAPVVVRAPVILPDGHGRQVALLLMTLMPGSMVQRVVTEPGVGDDVASGAPDEASICVELHTLAESLQPADQWARLQRRVAAAFGAR